jgi:predicted GIY-YIG superfamily endonuclease
MKSLIKSVLKTLILEQNSSKWTKEKVLDLAKKYDRMKDFRKENGYVYNLAYKNGWIDDIYQIIPRERKKIESFSEEQIIQIAKKYPTINQFAVNHPNVYQQAYNKGLINKLKQLIQPAYKKWDYESVSLEAEKYNNRKEFQKGSGGAYGWAVRHGVLDDITKNYNVLVTNYDENSILQTALEYETVKDFIENDYNTYAAAQRRKILPKVTAHMRPLGNQKKRMVYVYEFPDNHVYVGLSYDLKERDRNHRTKNKSKVFQHIQTSGLKPFFKQATPNYLSVENAQELEEKLINDYRSKGWKILNVAKAGGLGGGLKTLTFDEVKKIALQYDGKNDFRLGNRRAYQTAKREGWFDDVTSHMVDRMETWTPEKVIEMAKQYDYRVQVKLENPKLYSAISRMNLEDIAYQHMGEPRKNAGTQWDLDSLQDEISKYDNISDFRNKSPNAYQTIHRNPEYRYLLDSLSTQRKRWTDEEVFDEALQFNSIIDFRNNSRKAYDVAKRRNLVNDIRIKMGLKPRN